MKIGNKNITLKKGYGYSRVWYIIPTICILRDIFYRNNIEIIYAVEFQFINLFYSLRIKIQKPYDTQDF